MACVRAPVARLKKNSQSGAKTSRRLWQFEIKPGNNEVASLKASIEKDSANVATQSSTIEDLASSIATDEADLKVATEIRDVAGKVTSIDTASEVDIYHVTNDSEADFLSAIETAVTKNKYREYASLYELLLTVSIETDASDHHQWR